MTLYRYEAVAASGELISGEIEAAGEDALVDRLQAEGHTPIRVESTAGAGQARAAVRRRAGSARRSANLALLTQQLATLLHAGLSLDRALEVAQVAVGRKAERDGLRDILDRVRGGASLADAMAAQNGMFPGFYIGMVRAGEAGGSLDQTLRHLAEFLERTQEAREQIKSALLYPLIVLLTGCGSIAVLFGFVVPRFRPLFEDAGTALPLPAQMILTITDLIGNYWWAFVAGFAALAALVLQQARSAEGKRRWDRLVLRLPIVGILVQKSAISRFARTLGTLLRNGVGPLSALAIVEETVGNSAISEAVATLADSVKQGKGLAEPLSRLPLMPPLVAHLTRVGEETARLEEMLLKLADIYDQEARRGVERLLAMLVPAITVAMGAVVALVIGSILMAILSVYDLAI